jgi:alpha-ketoglutarate-dependent taurine dioxygenase
MRESQSIRRVIGAPELLSIEWEDGGVSEYSSVWLRDNLAEDRDAHSGQRLVDIVDVPERARIRSAVREDGGVRIHWEDEARPASFSFAWLAAHAAGRAPRRPELLVQPWLGGGSLDARRDFAWTSLAALHTPKLRLAWLTRLLQQGVAFLEEVPAEEGALLAAMPLVGRVLETNYGLTFDVRSVPQPENLAYSDLGLGLHTDNPYRDPVPGFQALHALIPSNEGGESLFADGFALAAHLRDTAPEAFTQLTTTAVPFLYRSKDAELYAERPLIQLAASGAVAAVHYNSRSIAPLAISAAQAPRFYAAYRCFAALMREARWQLRTRLGAGTLVVFDNQRILHGRTAFSSARHPRQLRGCYLTRDSVYSETALLRRRLPDTEGQA